MNALSQKRKGRITGSMAGAILGLSPMMTTEGAMRAMVRSFHGAESEFIGNIATDWGHANEPLAIMDYLARTGELIEQCGFVVHPVHGWLGATPDGYVGLDTIAEIKCPYGIRNDNPPAFKTAAEQPHYLAQMQVEMACSGRELCHFYQWTPNGDTLEIVRISEAWIHENIPKLESFYHQFLSELDNPAHLAPLRASVEGAEALLAEWDECAARISAAEARKKEILTSLVTLAEEKDAEVCGRKLTRVERKGMVDYSKIQALSGIDLEQYRKPGGEYWRLS